MSTGFFREKSSNVYVYFCHVVQSSHVSWLILNTGPSVHTHTLPFTVGSTQHRHAPRPHAIIFSSDTSQSAPMRRASRAMAFIIGSGPQQYMRSHFPDSALLVVTMPCSPADPSSVEMCSLPIFRTLQFAAGRFSILRRAEIPDSFRGASSSRPKYNIGATPTPPPESRIRWPGAGMVNPFPSGSTRFNSSPGRLEIMAAVPSPARRTSSQRVPFSRSTLLTEIGRRRNVPAELSTATSTNWPGSISSGRVALTGAQHQ